MFRKIVIALTLIATLAAAALPTFAQETDSHTFTRTEAEINDSYWVTNPRNRAFTDVAVDLQDGKTVTSATYTRRGQEPMSISATAVPIIEYGRIYWVVTEVTSDGEPVSDELLAQVNAHINVSWRNYWRRQAPEGRVTGVEITETEISITLSRR